MTYLNPDPSPDEGGVLTLTHPSTQSYNHSLTRHLNTALRHSDFSWCRFEIVGIGYIVSIGGVVCIGGVVYIRYDRYIR